MVTDWYRTAVRVRVDRAGRVVIPKPLRVALGIGPETELELGVDGAGLRLDPVGPRERPVQEHDGLPVLAFVEGARLTDQEVRRLRDETNR